MSKLPAPRCCDAAKRFIALRFGPELYDREYESPEAFLAAARDSVATPPRWTIIVVATGTGGVTSTERITRCPFCYGSLPSVRLRAKPPRRICAIVDGGYYCATCEERLMNCRCAPPGRLWEPAP